MPREVKRTMIDDSSDDTYTPHLISSHALHTSSTSSGKVLKPIILLLTMGHGLRYVYRMTFQRIQ